MPLLGWPLVLTLSVVTLVTMVVTLVAWPRVRGRRPLRAAQRVGLLLVTQVATVLLVAAGMNNYGYFFGSWSDLVGQTSSGAPDPATISRALGAKPDSSGTNHGRTGVVPSPTQSAVAHATQWATPAQWPTKGRVQAVAIAGAHSGMAEEALVYLPPQYFQPAYQHTRFPGVEVLTGYPGTTTALVERMHYPSILLSEMAHHRAKPMVLVMMRPTIAPPRDTECTDVPAGPLALTYFAEDVPRAVASDLRVNATGWGAMGDSTGGYCATKLAMTHSSIFTSAVSLSGYYHTLRDGTTGDLWGGSPEVRHLNDLEWLLQHQPAPPVSIYASIGTNELGHNGIVDTRRFASLVRPPMSVQVVTVSGGGHNFRDWSQVMPAGLDFLSRRLA